MKTAELKRLRAELKDARYDGLTHVEKRDKLRELTEEVDDATERPTWQLLGCANRGEMAVVMADPLKAQQLTMLLSMGTFSATENTLAATWKDIFGDGSKSFIALRRLGRRLGSRAESLGLGNVTESDIADAELRTQD